MMNDVRCSSLLCTQQGRLSCPFALCNEIFTPLLCNTETHCAIRSCNNKILTQNYILGFCFYVVLFKCTVGFFPLTTSSMWFHVKKTPAWHIWGIVQMYLRLHGLNPQTVNGRRTSNEVASSLLPWSLVTSYWPVWLVWEESLYLHSIIACASFTPSHTLHPEPVYVLDLSSDSQRLNFLCDCQY